MNRFLPVTLQDCIKRGWDSCDFILITGDAYIDHPSFGAAVVGRFLEHVTFRVGIISQPDWKDVEAFRVLGRPNLAFLITSGNLDSMVNHFTSSGRRRKRDTYSPGGRGGLRPDRACIVYTAVAKQAYKGVPVILGGIEASLRRLSHYDYWSDSVRRSILLDAKADLVVYGMGENPMKEVAALLREGRTAGEITGVPGTVWKTRDLSSLPGCIRLPPFGAVEQDNRAFAESTRVRLLHQDPFSAGVLTEEYNGWHVVQNPPAYPLSRKELDLVYGLPYTRRAHPSYEAAGGVPALEEVRFSITGSRGCFGGCSFCALTFHQGRIVTSRSHGSIIKEAKGFIRDPEFKGYIHDVGGPTANFRVVACEKQKTRGSCAGKECLFPEPCSHLKPDHSDFRTLLRKLRELPGIKKVFIRSGIRYDYLLCDEDGGMLKDLVEHHVSGQLKVAPEHSSPGVLDAMGKPPVSVFKDFAKRFEAISRNAGKKQFLIPYFITSHPGSGLREAIDLAVFLKESGFIPDQVQEFLPTPGTVSTCMYHTGVDPRTMRRVYAAKDREERAMQRALVHFHKPENVGLVRKALKKAGREDLVGFGKRCLVPPERGKKGADSRNRY